MSKSKEDWIKFFFELLPVERFVSSVEGHVVGNKWQMSRVDFNAVSLDW